MEGTEEKKDGQTEGQAIRWKKIQQDTKADHSTDERETMKRKDRRKSRQGTNGTYEAIMAVQRAILR